MMKFLVNALKTALMLSIVVAGCTDPAPSSESAPAASDVPPVPQFDMTAIMEAMAVALQAEAAVLHKAVHAVETVTEDDRRALWAAMQDQERAADRIKTMLEANPTWVESACGWYTAVIQKPQFETVGLRKQLLSRFSDSGIGGDWWRLLKSAAPSEDAARAHLKAINESPGSPTNLYIMCVKFGHIKEDK